MQIRGSIRRDGKWWVAQCETLQANTQGTSRKDGLAMMKDWVQGMLDDPSFDFDIRMDGDAEFVMTFADPRRILGLIVARYRGMSALTFQQVADRMGISHRTAVQQAETGKSELSVSRLGQILEALGYEVELVVRQKQGETIAARKAKPTAAASRRRTTVRAFPESRLGT